MLRAPSIHNIHSALLLDCWPPQAISEASRLCRQCWCLRESEPLGLPAPTGGDPGRPRRYWAEGLPWRKCPISCLDATWAPESHYLGAEVHTTCHKYNQALAFTHLPMELETCPCSQEKERKRCRQPSLPPPIHHHRFPLYLQALASRNKFFSFNLMYLNNEKRYLWKGWFLSLLAKRIWDPGPIYPKHLCPFNRWRNWGPGGQHKSPKVCIAAER